MKWDGICLVVICVIGLVSSQKLFFKSNRLLQQEIDEAKKIKDDVVGFGFGVARKYFTEPKQETEQPKATCCIDKIHCCPFGTKCDMGRQACISGEMIVPWFEKTAGISIADNKADEAVSVESVICPDGEHQCADGQTCCKSADGYSCCPLPKAVCCADQVHCCPENTKCDVTHGKCDRSNGDFISMVKKQSAVKRILTKPKVHSYVQCDDKHACPTANTCCLLDNGEWGCCPKPSAVCCSDHLHCCPQGTKCDNTSSSCVDGSQTTPWLSKTPAVKLENVKCDSTHECPSENTCCKLASGQWGCCPLPKAVCCSDGVHCCPDGTTCDVSSGKCNRGNTQVDWFVKTTAIEVSNVKCDSTHECPSENTCCKLASGQWGCCPLPKAVCCSDGVHCCPDGTTCDVSSGKCNRGNTQVDWFVKTTAIEVSNVKCDSTHECPSENTCCKLASGQWGCCPLPKAVCCSDGVHCCPDGTTCDVSSGKCNRENAQVRELAWSTMKLSEANVRDVICPDGSECQDGETCCRMNGANTYGCCPLPNAVCCDDGQHCCPHSYRCNLASGMCERGYVKLPWIRTNVVKKQPTNVFNTAHLINLDIIKSIPMKKEVNDIKCSDGTTCQDQYSCCPNAKGGFNCCPMPNGVCCPDNVHCCPHGYICDEEPGICRIPELNKAVSTFIKQLGSKKAIPHL